MKESEIAQQVSGYNEARGVKLVTIIADKNRKLEIQELLVSEGVKGKRERYA
jgi:hypothetical protein